MPKRLFLIDGTALAYRSHFAFAASARGGLNTKTGKPTSAAFGFATTLIALLEREQPDAVAVAFDGAVEDLDRTKIYADYKSTRDKMPDELQEQFEAIEAIVRGYGIAVIAGDSHEADDVIGTLAVRGRDAGMEVFIVTADKDFMQLVGPHIKLWNLRTSTRAPEIIGPAEVEAKYGVPPERMIDLLALMGDSSDNIPGVPRVGQKTAAGLLAEYGTLDGVLAHAGDVKQPSIRQSLSENRALAELSRKLVTIHTGLELDLDVASLTAPRPDRKALERIYREMEFNSLLARLPPEPAPQIAQDYRIVRTAAELDALLAELRAAGRFAFDTETTSLEPLDAELVGVSFALDAGRAWYVPFNAQPPVVEGGRNALLERLRPLLEDASLRKTLQNAKYDASVLRTAGVELRGIDFDTMLASYCLNPGLGAHNLDALSLRYFSHKKIATKELLGTGRKQLTFDQVDIERAGAYAAEDADFTARLRTRLEPELEEAGLTPLLRGLELPLIPVLIGMEREGIRVDLEHLARLAKDWEARLAQIETRIYERAGEPFNLNSPAQIGQVLFEKLEVHKAAGIARPRKTRTGQFKTDASILEALAHHHEVPDLLLEYRRLAKLKGTYVDALPALVNARTGRIHTSFNQAVAATGRLSSDNPNLQNIPIRTPEGQEVRKAFVPRADGWRLLSADYSQIELRILAHICGDRALIDAFKAREDIHARTASIVHGVLPAMVTPDLRAKAKIVNYGLIYGMGASRLARETGMTPPEAKKFIDAYFRALPGIKRYLDETLAKAREERAVWTLFGRRRPLPDIVASNAMQRIAAENMAVNSPIQGTAADIIKKAMLVLHRDLEEHGLRARLLLQVHDELVLDVPEDEIETATALLRAAMEGAVSLKVPLEVSVGTGRNWLEAH
jgi:DNA polymerase-1